MAKIENNWLTYDWKHEGFPSITRVDPKYYMNENLQGNRSLLMRLSISPNSNKRDISSFTMWKINRAAQKASEEAEKRKVVLVAARTLGTSLELYFYNATDEELHLVAEKAKSGSLKCDYIIWNDPFWDTYTVDLYPSIAQYQTIYNKEMREKLESAGDDVVSVRRINHYCSFPNEISRLSFESEALNAGFAIGNSFYSPEAENPHCCCVRNMSSIDKPSIDATTTKLIKIVTTYDGIYDYWDCPIMRKSRTKNAIAKK